MIVFDWGGVILRICRSFAEGATAAGLDVRDGLTDPQMHDVRRAIGKQYQVGEIDDDAFFAAVSDSMNGVYTPDEIAAVHDAWLLGEYDGVADLVDALHTASIETALLSNTNARHWGRREQDFPTAGRLRHQHASHLLRLAKPDVAIYHAFAEVTRREPGELLFFDDLPENVDAARAAGWRSECIDHQGDTAAQMRTHLAAHGISL